MLLYQEVPACDEEKDMYRRGAGQNLSPGRQGVSHKGTKENYSRTPVAVPLDEQKAPLWKALFALASKLLLRKRNVLLN